MPVIHETEKRCIKVSIVCTVYNKAKWLRQTIDSFLTQKTTFDYEIILIDDASTDNSASIIRDYAERFPELIKAYYNEKNLGIIATWRIGCKVADVHSTYIARCDGDDYWFNVEKLEKQVQYMEKIGAKWSGTDIDYVDEHGKIKVSSVFESQYLPKTHSFEEMLATRGFTAPSTWLIDRNLILEVNDIIADDTADDTFDIQLELFKRTVLSYLPISTTAYRINEGSDSRPSDFKKTQKRFYKLLETQKKYVRKYPDSDRNKIIDILLERNNAYELLLSQQSQPQAKLLNEKVTIYFADGDGQFSQKNIQTFPLLLKDNLIIELPEGCQKIRVDLSERSSYYSVVTLSIGEEDLEVIPAFTNGVYIERHYLFTENDPQIIYELPSEYHRTVNLHYQMITTSSEALRYLVNYITQKEADNDLTHLQLINRLNLELEAKQRNLEKMIQRYNAIVHSRRWMISTKMINFFRRRK